MVHNFPSDLAGSWSNADQCLLKLSTSPCNVTRDKIVREYGNFT